MPDKTYCFRKILAEYNKCNATTYHILDNVDNPVITYSDSEIFYVTYNEIGYNSSRKKSMYDFTYYHIRPSRESLSELFEDMIREKEEKKLTTELKILPSNKIRYAYLYTNYFSGAGILGSSCMRNKDNQKALNFYVKNNVQIVVVIDNNGKIHARALLWENVKNTERKDTFTFTYLDRVYARSDKFIERFYTLAKKNKWHYYASTSAGRARGSYYIDNVDIKGVCHLPYTDTFRFLYYKDSLIGASTSTATTKRVKDKDSCVTLTHTTEGGYVPALDPDRVREVFTNNHISKKDAVRVSRYKGYVLKKNIVDINGDYYSRHDKVIINSKIDGFILKENSVDEVFSNQPIDKTKAVYSEKHKGYVHKQHAVHIKDEIYHNKDTDITQFDGKWYHISECFVNYDREKVNEELAKQGIFFYKSLPETWMASYQRTTAVPTRKEGLIPKERAIIAYDIICIGMSAIKSAGLFTIGNPKFNTAKFLKGCNKDHLEYQEVYRTSKVGLIQLIDGTLIIDSSNNRQYLKRWNGRWYIKQEFEAPNKKQPTFNFK